MAVLIGFRESSDAPDDALKRWRNDESVNRILIIKIGPYLINNAHLSV
jgi:hypothetical protein